MCLPECFHLALPSMGCMNTDWPCMSGSCYVVGKDSIEAWTSMVPQYVCLISKAKSVGKHRDVY